MKYALRLLGAVILLAPFVFIAVMSYREYHSMRPFLTAASAAIGISAFIAGGVIMISKSFDAK